MLCGIHVPAIRRVAAAQGLQRRYFSSPSLEKSQIGLWPYARRVRDRLDSFQRYRESGVFEPNSSTVKKWLLFLLLQRLSSTEIDAVEFLSGAQVACDRIIGGRFSPEMMDYASGRTKAKPEIAIAMEEMLSPLCYQRDFLPKVILSADTDEKMGLRTLGYVVKFKGVYLTGVSVNRMTLEMYKAFVAVKKEVAATIVEARKGKKPTERVREMDLFRHNARTKRLIEEEMSKSIKPEDALSRVERAQLDVLFNTLITVTMTDAERSQEGSATEDFSFTLRFESLVTQPNQIEWRITSFRQLA